MQAVTSLRSCALDFFEALLLGKSRKFHLYGDRDRIGFALMFPVPKVCIDAPIVKHKSCRFGHARLCNVHIESLQHKFEIQDLGGVGVPPLLLGYCRHELENV
eukprot:TRINITY_DN14468_c0_g1_i1.p2 TRINITY_DN14468_c0_g1~~TRINITY_DN14468_c0_g1_i1.p2  ORF type:complete len:103 (-),score=4.27 TRINITY_DN14468_c0_g1_i1:100-408(-)